LSSGFTDAMTCPECGHENPGGARFCSNCGAQLIVGERGPSREERKVVTVLFADLVGFTSRAEQMDPEDVRAVLEPYHARLRTELERRGGTVEKFIGDAVMALFGAPTAHEDDPERAVRAALAIRDSIREEGDLEVRIAVTTGEALVALGARPTEGEGMASGDVVNTAARLQSAAPVNGILVDETTHRATNQKIDYDEAEPVSAKGKREPVPSWEALQAHSSYGVDVVRTQRAPLIGRERELEVLVNALARVRAERSPQLVTLVGVPGIGKSRLVYELSEVIEQEAEITSWRQGRSLPYGEGSFWALGEMVKAQAGILETDSAEDAAAKLSQGVRQLVDDSEADWVERHLGTLVGLEGEELRGENRAEAFAAWRRFFEAIAEERPLVLVFEDLHWADEGLLDFVDHLVDWAGGVPILVVGTARPELLSRRGGWGGGKPNALTLSLSPLDDDETARLVAALLERSVLPAETQTALLQRAGGNPLYAEEFVRMVTDRGIVAGAEELPLPESVQGIVAARLDALPDDEKTLLQDASVFGKVFWLGAAAEIGGLDRHAAEEALHRLERKEFVRRERRPSVASESEYVFGHLLVRDVAYSQIPRTRRAEKHRLAGEWIERLGRFDDHAEMLAHHYSSALELARAAGSDSSTLEGPARRALREAGDRAYALNAFPAASGFYTSALELWPADEEGRADLLFRHARSVHSIEPLTSLDLVTEARDALLAASDISQAAEAEVLGAEIFWLIGQRDEGYERVRAAQTLIADQPSSYSKAYVLANLSRFAALAGVSEEAIRFGREALAMAEQLEVDSIRSHALNNMGFARVNLGDEGGIDDIEQSTAIAVAANSVESVRAYGNLASTLADLGRLERASAARIEARRLGERFGVRNWLMWVDGDRCWDLYFQGRWEELGELDALISESVETEFWLESPLRLVRGRLRLARGDVGGAQEDADRGLVRARDAKDPQVMWPALAFAARVCVASDRGRSERLALELLSGWKENGLGVGGDIAWLSELAVALVALGGENELAGLVERSRIKTPWRRAAAAYVSGNFQEAAAEYASIGALPDEAYARLRAAEALVAEGRRAEANAELKRALGFWRSVGATAYVREGEALLAEAG
jgi:class 3 adenylate cyclase/tetratricopeptide (TPR) repeat protein